jgi:RNA polymerase sigma-70 factor (ECF subfamily)
VPLLIAPDAELVARACDGDHEAEEALYRRHVRYVAGILSRLLLDPTETEDAIQETFVIALEQLARLRDRAAVRGWLAQIAVSRARSRFRRRKLLRILGLDAGAEESTLESLASNDASAEVRSELIALSHVLNRLSTELRLAWTLRNVEGLALEEVATACACSLATAKRRIAAADITVRLAMDNEVAL